MTLAMIVAVADNGVIGRDGGLPWRLAADLKRFKRLTMGHHLIVGRRTWEEIGQPLPGRTIVVITRAAIYQARGAAVVGSLDEALAVAATDDEPFVAGGAEIYRLALPRVERLYLTRVLACPEGDTVLDPLDLSDWQLVSRDRQPADERNQYPCDFEIWDRCGARQRPRHAT